MEENIQMYPQKAELLKALAHPVRLQIVRGLLKEGCRNVSCMEQHLNQSQSSISQHLAKLKSAGVVRARRAGNEVYYEAASPDVAELIAVLFGDDPTGYEVRKEAECPCRSGMSG